MKRPLTAAAALRRRPGVPAVLAGLAAMALGLSACSGSGAVSGGSGGGGGGATAQPSAPANPGGLVQPAGKLSWHTCPAVPAPARCARLAVPLDYAHPGGRTITLALNEIPATAPAGQRLGPLLVNPGGPGGSGLSLALYVAGALPRDVSSRYDIIGFDPRGVGDSVPALHCDPSFFSGVRPAYDPASKAAEQVLVSRAKAYAAGCERRFGWLLPHMTTADNARDMDAIRAALGAPKMSYFAYSYGTYLGQVYATLFPGHVRRMVLDSTVGPGGVWYQDNINQDYAFQGRANAFFAWVAQHDDAYGLGSTQAQVAAQYQAALRELAAHPVNGPDGPLVGPAELTDTMLQGGYNNSYWPELATALAEYRRGMSNAALTQAYQQLGVTHENEFAVYNATECSDAAWPRNWARWDADTRKVNSAAPFETWGNAWFNAACAFWPVRGPAQPMKIGAAGLPGILMLQGTLDAATPYAGAQQARRALGTARMVVVTGGGNHGQSLANPANTCVNGYLARYLATGALPAGTGAVAATCPALPPPSAT
ncbi:MAG TPA: alpha/beta hydrolase [Streptosporangiaceae bacterium]|jgi:pimeloyl-ACP methyl ester carboxylesterase|nr:alpha/beta hydrolase [Streptosporangiaceae bacterium]